MKIFKDIYNVFKFGWDYDRGFFWLVIIGLVVLITFYLGIIIFILKWIK